MTSSETGFPGRASVVAISSLDFSEGGAAQARHLHIVKGLARRPGDVVLINLKRSPPAPDGFGVTSAPGVLSRLPWRAQVFLVLAPTLMRRLWRRPAWILCFDRDPQVLSTACVIGRLFGAQVIHEMTEYPSEVVPAGWSGRVLLTLFERVLAPRIGRYLVISRALADYALTRSPAADVLLAPAMAAAVEDGGAQGPRPASPYARFLYAGAFSEKKDGVDSLIKAFARVVAARPDARLDLYGHASAARLAELRDIIGAAGLSERVAVRPPVPQAAIAGLLTQADALVLCRPYSKQAEGGFSTKLVEYLASGRPVVATLTGDMGRYLEDGVSAFLAPANDVPAFADRMLAAIDDTGHAEQVGRRGRDIFVRYFDADGVSDRIWDWLHRPPTPGFKP